MTAENPEPITEAQVKEPAITVVGASGQVYETTKVTDENLGKADSIVPNGPSFP